MILTLRTDTFDTSLTLLHSDGQEVARHDWHAGRQLAKELLAAIHDLLESQEKDWQDLTGIIVYKGPGSFTGLRIGVTVANTIAYAQHIPVIAAEGDNWITNGITRLHNKQDDRIALPHYGAEAHITQPRK